MFFIINPRKFSVISPPLLPHVHSSCFLLVFYEINFGISHYFLHIPWPFIHIFLSSSLLSSTWAPQIHLILASFSLQLCYLFCKFLTTLTVYFISRNAILYFLKCSHLICLSLLDYGEQAGERCFKIRTRNKSQRAPGTYLEAGAYRHTVMEKLMEGDGWHITGNIDACTWHLSWSVSGPVITFCNLQICSKRLPLRWASVYQYFAGLQEEGPDLSLSQHRQGAPPGMNGRGQGLGGEEAGKVGGMML